MTKDSLAKVVYDLHGGISYKEAQRIIDNMLDTIKGKLLEGDKIMLTGFGVFHVVNRKQRRGINPQSGDSILIKSRKYVSFKPSKILNF
jgi:integration host factor subunit alpha